MKATIFLLLLIWAVLYPQTPNHIETKYVSANGSYEVSISGLFYEGYVGNQTIKLKNSNTDQLLWEKGFGQRGLGRPYVSSNGNVAIVVSWNNIEIYSPSGQKLSTFTLPQNLKFEDDESVKDQNVFAFINGGDEFVSIAREQKQIYKPYLFCTTLDGSMEWRVELPEMMFLGVIFEKGKYLVIHDLKEMPRDMQNTIVVLNKEGEIIKVEKVKYLRQERFKGLEIIDDGLKFKIITNSREIVI